MLQQSDLRAARKSLERLFVGLTVFFQEVLHEDGNVFGTLRQAGNANFDAAEPVEKVLAKTPGKNFHAEVAICRGNHSHVHFLHFGRADALDLSILNHAEQLGLHLQRRFTDFIEENSPVICVFEQTWVRLRCARERAANVSEELAFEKRIDQGRTEQLHTANRSCPTGLS